MKFYVVPPLLHPDALPFDKSINGKVYRCPHCNLFLSKNKVLEDKRNNQITLQRLFRCYHCELTF